MSTFSGKFVEGKFKRVSIDKFTRETYDSVAFFLSHLHTDHMEGMWDYSFQNMIRENKDTFLYCSDITKEFLLKKPNFSIPSSKICCLVRDGTVIKLGEEECIKVTPLNAGHCPGSIMLLFEGFGLRILYTGDFRCSMTDIKKFRRLHDKMGEVLPLDSVYLDTTFASPDYPYFPTREQSLDLISKEIEGWLQKSEKHRVVIHQPGNTGIEYLMVELNKRFNSRIHVSNRGYEEFASCVNSLLDVVTTDFKLAKIHFCMVFKGCCDCPSFSGIEVLHIYPKAKYFTKDILENQGPVERRSPEFVNIVYSSHSSLGELKEFIDYLKPAKVYASVVRPPFSSSEEVIRMINNLSPLKSQNQVKEKERRKHPSNEKIYVKSRRLSFDSVKKIYTELDLDD